MYSACTQHAADVEGDIMTDEARTRDADVIVVGGGNAAFTAAHAAAERGRRVVLLEKAPEDQAGG
ncbi:FAD-binding protein, partial [Streptomyces sp. NPDC056728]